MSAWCGSPERGAAWLVRLMLWLMRRIGWFANHIVLPGISLWFFTFSASARAASRDYLGRALGRPATGRDVLRHIHVFACAILDRALMLTGRGGAISVETSGLEALEAALRQGSGGVLIGAHLGSFAMLRRLAERCPVPVRMLMYRGNDGAFSRAMASLDPAMARDVIPIGDVQAMLRAHDAVAAGGLVGMLADRAPAGARSVGAMFLGQVAQFPAGPFVLAASLRAPVFLFRGVRRSRGRYRVTFTPFGERIVLRRATREADLAEAVQRYAAWLEQSCREDPFNWFNFFPFWKPAPHAPTQARPSLPAARLPAAAAADPPLLGAKPAVG